jgi:hypothetical protein
MLQNPRPWRVFVLADHGDFGAETLGYGCSYYERQHPNVSEPKVAVLASSAERAMVGVCNQ